MVSIFKYEHFYARGDDRFGSARSAKEEQELIQGSIPPSTRYATKWTLKIFNEWRGTRETQEQETGYLGLQAEDDFAIQLLSTSLEDMSSECWPFGCENLLKRLPIQTENGIPHELCTALFLV